MKKILYSIAIAILYMSIGHNTTMAQSNIEENSLFYHSIRMPQINSLNPALFPSNNSFYLSLPRANVMLNSPLSLCNVLTHQPGDTVTYIDVNQVLDQLTTENRLRIGAEADIIGFGMKFGYTFVTLSSKVIVNSAFGLPISAINFLTQGNIDSEGNPISQINVVDGDLLNMQAYGELAIGVGHKFNNLTVGFKVKRLLGILNANTTDTYVKLNTSESLDDLQASVYYKLKIASVLDWDNPTGSIKDIKPIKPNSVKDWIPQSRGFAFDIGAQYQFGPLSVSASILDMSRGINWNQNVYDITPENEGNFHFDGLAIDGNDLLNGNAITLDTLTGYFKQQLDSLNPKFERGDSYWHSVPTRINVGASLKLWNMMKIGLLMHGQFDHGLLTTKQAVDYGSQTFRHNTTLSVTLNLINWLELTVASGITSDSKKISFFNPGVSVSLTPFTMIQIYAAMDYASSLYLVDVKRLNFMLGANILIGRGGAKKL